MNLKKESIFKRIDDLVLNSPDDVFRVKGKYYGKPLFFKLMGRAIRGYNATLVSEQLKHKGGKYANLMQRLIASGINNAINSGFVRDRIYIRTLSVGPGTYLKRREFKGRGRSGAIWRPHAKVTLELKGVSVGQ
jgi:ribosomal protein L22